MHRRSVYGITIRQLHDFIIFALSFSQEAKRELASKDAMVAEGLRVAKDEKAAFDRDLQAAKAEIVRLRDMAESQANLDESFKVRYGLSRCKRA